MKITIESTNEFVHANGVPARVWTAAAPRGTPLMVLVTRLGALPGDPESEATLADLEWLRSGLGDPVPTRLEDPSGSVVVEPRNCSVCLAQNRRRPANYVARGVDGGEWFECGDHEPTDNVAETVRTSLTPIDEWFDRANLPLPGGDAARASVATALRRVADAKVSELASECRSLRERLKDSERETRRLHTLLADARTASEPSWLVKDFHVLYRAAREAHQDPTSELRRTWLGDQLTRLAPAFDVTESARATASLVAQAEAERATAKLTARGTAFDVATELGVELARAMRQNIDEVEGACAALGIEHPPDGMRPVIDERDVIDSSVVRAILDDPRVCGEKADTVSGGRFLAHALRGAQMAWHARAAHPRDVALVRRLATPIETELAAPWLFGFDLVLDLVLDRATAGDTETIPPPPPGEVQS